MTCTLHLLPFPWERHTKKILPVLQAKEWGKYKSWKKKKRRGQGWEGGQGRGRGEIIYHCSSFPASHFIRSKLLLSPSNSCLFAGCCSIFAACQCPYLDKLATQHCGTCKVCEELVPPVMWSLFLMSTSSDWLFLRKVKLLLVDIFRGFIKYYFIIICRDAHALISWDLYHILL